MEDDPKFLAAMKSTFRDYTRRFVADNKRTMNEQQQEVERLTLENAQLNERLRESRSSEESELMTLRAKVNQLEDQLRCEQSQRSSVEKMKRKAEEDLIELKHKFSEFQLHAKCQDLNQRSRVNSEVNQLRSEMGKYHKLEDMVASLKENQNSLQRTNEQLGRELSILRMSHFKDSSINQSFIPL